MDDRKPLNGEWNGTGYLNGWGEDDDDVTEFSATITDIRVAVYVHGEQYEQSDPLEIFYTGAQVDELTSKEIFSLIAATVC